MKPKPTLPKFILVFSTKSGTQLTYRYAYDRPEIKAYMRTVNRRFVNVVVFSPKGWKVAAKYGVQNGKWVS